MGISYFLFFFFSSRRRHTRYIGDWSSDVCSSDLGLVLLGVDHDAIDRAGSLAGEAGGADLEVDLEDAAVAEGERVLDPHPIGEPVGILDRVGPSDEV